MPEGPLPSPGQLKLRPTPQGQRLSLTLTYQGRPVTAVVPGPDLLIAPQTEGPLLPEVSALPVLDRAARERLAGQVRALAAGLARAVRPQVRVAL